MRHGRIWIIWLWGVLVALLWAGTDFANRTLHEHAQARPLLLLPRERLTDQLRTEIATELSGFKDIASIRWLSPSTLAQETADAIDHNAWPELFPQEEAWLPWVAEVHLRDPLFMPEVIRARLQSFKQDARWRLVLWDEEAMERDVEIARRVWINATSAGMLIFLLGFVGLIRTSGSGMKFVHECILGALGALALIGAMGGVAKSTGIPLDVRFWCMAGGAGFILAGIVGPMIKGEREPAPSAPEVPIR